MHQKQPGAGDPPLGLYAFVRKDVERRLLDRMEGAVAAVGDEADRSAAVRAALLAGFDFAVREGFLQILGAPPVGAERDGLAEILSASTATASPVLGRVHAAAWRAALAAVAEGSQPQPARAALIAFELRVP